ncbi:MAG: response regulator [Ignavibacteriae bacterium]|nr:MAG: response regulator [Ignavibacteriota bacterium]
MSEQLLNVLIVDDEPTYRIVLTQTLKGCGHTTEACESGDDAISLLQKNKYDVVLLDYKMPGTSGINVLQWMYGMKMDVPVILITGYGSEEIALEAWKWGARDYFVKGKSDMSQLPDLVLKVYRQVISERQRRSE